MDIGGARRSVAVTSLPSVACVEDPQAFAQGIDKSKWEQSQIQDKWSDVRTKVARQVQLGNREDALNDLRAYKADTAGLNALVKSEEVDANLQDVEELEASVEDAFSGAAQEQQSKRNTYSKGERLQSLDSRRAGAKK